MFVLTFCTRALSPPSNNGASSRTQGMFDWVDILESKLDSMSPVGTDLETVKHQIVELKVGRVTWQIQQQKTIH